MLNLKFSSSGPLGCLKFVVISILTVIGLFSLLVILIDEAGPKKLNKDDSYSPTISSPTNFLASTYTIYHWDYIPSILAQEARFCQNDKDIVTQQSLPLFKWYNWLFSQNLWQESFVIGCQNWRWCSIYPPQIRAQLDLTKAYGSLARKLNFRQGVSRLASLVPHDQLKIGFRIKKVFHPDSLLNPKQIKFLSKSISLASLDSTSFHLGLYQYNELIGLIAYNSSAHLLWLSQDSNLLADFKSFAMEEKYHFIQLSEIPKFEQELAYQFMVYKKSLADSLVKENMEFWKNHLIELKQPKSADLGWGTGEENEYVDDDDDDDESYSARYSSKNEKPKEKSHHTLAKAAVLLYLMGSSSRSRRK